MKLLNTELCFVGHTHVPRVYELKENHAVQTPFKLKRNFISSIDSHPLRKADWTEWNDAQKIINPGSVGRAGDGDTHASYLIVDFDARKMLIRRVKYPLKPFLKKMRALNVNDFPFNQSVQLRLSYAIGDVL